MAKRKDDEEDRFEKTRRVWGEITQRVLTLRSKDREFHGLQGELRTISSAIRERFEKSKDIKHPRDVGTEREQIVKSFLSESGLFPKKYGISHCSTRVVGSNGAISREMDILLFNNLDNLILKKYDNVLEFFPFETVYGAISIKSRANKKEIRNGLDNIVSFKSLYPGRESDPNNAGARAFGILLAFTSDLSSADLYNELKDFAATTDSTLLPNLVVILDSGSYYFGNENAGYLLNDKLDGTDGKTIYPSSDIMGDGLYYLYERLMGLLQARRTTEVSPSNYFSLPILIDGCCYSFEFGAASEEAICEKHGHYLRRMKAGRIHKIIHFMKTHKQIEWLRAIDLGRGESGTNEAAYERQPGWIYLYNPDDFPVDKIMFNSKGFNAYDSLIVEGLHIWVPWVYWIKEDLFHDCPMCEAAAKNRSRRRKGKAQSGETGEA